MWLIAGLGNPGERYRYTRHNIGFLTLQRCAKDNGISLVKEHSCEALVGRGQIAGKKVMLLLPQTYMNKSGESVMKVFSREIKSLERVMVVCDDINLELGRMRMKPKGSSGRHKGLESIIACLGTRDFARLRMGIATGVHEGDISGYVLEPFTKRQMKDVSRMIERAQQALEFWLDEGIEAAMNWCNLKTPNAERETS